MRPQFNFDLSVSSHFAFYNGIFNATSDPLELHLFPFPLALATLLCCLFPSGALSACDKNISTLIRRSRKKTAGANNIFNGNTGEPVTHTHKHTHTGPNEDLLVATASLYI